MIHIEIINTDGVALKRTYSDENRYVIRQDGIVYCDAVDPIDSDRTYTEGELIPAEEAEQEQEDNS